MAAQGPQAQHHHQRQADNEEQRHHARHARVGAEGLGTQRQAVAGRIEIDRIAQGVVRRPDRRVRRQHLPGRIDDAQAVLLVEPVRHQMAHHALDGVHADERAQVSAPVLHRHIDLEQRRAAMIDIGLAVGRPPRGEGLGETQRLRTGEALAGDPLGGLEGRRPADDLAGIDPDEVGQFRRVGEVLRGAHLEGAAVELALGHLARHLRKRVLRALHVQAHRLLGPLHVATERVVLQVGLALLQAPDERQHGHGKDADGDVGNAPDPVALAGSGFAAHVAFRMTPRIFARSWG